MTSAEDVVRQVFLRVDEYDAASAPPTPVAPAAPAQIEAAPNAAGMPMIAPA
jgi:hypothetical protein